MSALSCNKPDSSLVVRHLSFVSNADLLVMYFAYIICRNCTFQVAHPTSLHCITRARTLANTLVQYSFSSVWDMEILNFPSIDLL